MSYKQIIRICISASLSSKTHSSLLRYFITQTRKIPGEKNIIILYHTLKKIKDIFHIGNNCDKHLRFTFEVSTSFVYLVYSTVYKICQFQYFNIVGINFQIFHETNDPL